jgi:hypothetical protein
MEYLLKWFIPNRVVYVRLWGASSIEEASQLNAKMLEFIAAGTPLVHFIVDDTELKVVPNSLGEMQRAMRALKNPSMGWVLTVGEVNAVMRFFGQMAAQLFRFRFRRLRTMEEALRFLRDVDQTLNWEQADQTVFERNVVKRVE